MTPLVTACLLALTLLVGACDSNPTPHPEGDAGRPPTHDAYTPGAVSGEVTGSEPGGRNDGDYDPSTGFGEGGEPAYPADAVDNKTDAAGGAAEFDDVLEASDAADDNATDTTDADEEADCGPSEVQVPPPSAADNQVE